MKNTEEFTVGKEGEYYVLYKTIIRWWKKETKEVARFKYYKVITKYKPITFFSLPPYYRDDTVNYELKLISCDDIGKANSYKWTVLRFGHLNDPIERIEYSE